MARYPHGIASAPQDRASPGDRTPSSPPAQQRWRGRLRRFLFTAVFQLPEIYYFFHRQPDFSSWILLARGLLFCSDAIPAWHGGGEAPIGCCLGDEKGTPAP